MDYKNLKIFGFEILQNLPNYIKFEYKTTIFEKKLRNCIIINTLHFILMKNPS